MNFNKLFFTLFSLFFSAECLSANDNSTLSCSPLNSKENITIEQINISPSMPIGTALNNTKINSRNVGNCNYKGQSGKLNPQPFVLYNAPDFNEGNKYPNVEYDFGVTKCPVYKTGHQGIGISWANYNSGQGTWYCIYNGLRRGLPTNQGSSNKIEDRVVFVRSENKVETGNFVYGKVLNAVYVAGFGASNQGAKVGYEITVSGRGHINLGECNVELNDPNITIDSVKLKDISTNSLSPSPTFPDKKITATINCSGFRDSNLAYYKVTPDSYYDNGNFASSKDGNVGMSLYMNGRNISYGGILSSSIINVPGSSNNEGVANIDLTPALYSKLSDLKKIKKDDSHEFKIKIESAIP